MSRTIELQISLGDARERILDRAQPGESIEISLGEALGLVLAEPVVADVDLPPFDRVSHDGYAVRADEATVGALCRVVGSGRSGFWGDRTIEAGEASRVVAGDPLPAGADCVLRPSSIRPDPEVGLTRVIEVRRAGETNRNIARRGAYLSAGTTILPAGTRIRPAMIPLLAAQGCVHPVCHRRVRLGILTVGKRWVRPDEAPSMNRERNAANAALVALTIQTAAMPHDLQAVSGAAIQPALERAATNSIVVVLGSSFRPVARPLRSMGYEPVLAGVTTTAIGRARYGVIRDLDGTVVNHIIHLPANPVAASVGFALLVEPLIARLQGAVDCPTRSILALAAGEEQPATGRRARLVPVAARTDAAGRDVAESIAAGLDDLAAWSRADGVLVFPPHAGPWRGADPVEFVPIGAQI